ncbi:MAG: 16S rRNA (cytidine(1402)-2'-O)-methyltransferase [Candidatus Pelagibacter sp.]|nr:16S rRNA (cytidine(1402)-2'-O)-methyltransferase [Candidatus Pelagibacter sp.]OUW24412.1 MAG: 16S rRNA (cytidine(1402)-2'-O)-methyltransferase [Rickettsiales bacterium TMED174]|tara:strand:+ start:996 stop:1826 length:831 start_codon:yes stop_codon:yes gene_type:complete
MILKGLYIVSTPIGNLEDITLRAIKILKLSDFILCEDTRRTSKLLKHFKINKPLISYHKFNEKKNIPKIIRYLNEGKILSLVSDAGTPILSDPGNLLVEECINKKISVIPIPGPSSLTAAMSVSSFDDQFIFYGFLPKKDLELEKELKKLSNINFAIVAFIPSLRVNFYIKYFKKHFDDRKILIAREISKLHETFYRNNVKDLELFTSTLKGELTIVLSKKIIKKEIDRKKEFKEMKILAKSYLKKYSMKDTVNLISLSSSISKKIIYDYCLKIKK